MVPPVLSTAAAPLVSATTGLGTGGGASVSTPDGQGFGEVKVFVGPGVSSTGSVTLVFAQTPPTLFYGLPPEFGTVTVTSQGATTQALSWTGATLSAARGSKPYTFSYEWSVSQ